jgi:hypothetical protein
MALFSWFESRPRHLQQIPGLESDSIAVNLLVARKALIEPLSGGTHLGPATHLNRAR